MNLTHKIMWRNIFEGISDFFVNVALKPFDALAELELSNWWAANFFTWIAIGVLVVLLVYWIGQLKKFDDNNEEDKSIKSHSFFD